MIIFHNVFFFWFQLASGLQNWVEDHSNITMFNLLHIQSFQNTIILTQNTPKTIKGKISLSPHLKEHKCLSLIQLQWKLEDFSSFAKKLSGKLCISPMIMVWYCCKWNYKHPTTTAATQQTCPAPSLYTGLSEGYLHDGDLTLNSFLTMFISVFCWREVDQLSVKTRIKVLFCVLVFTHFRECFRMESRRTSRSCHFKSSSIPLENKENRASTGSTQATSGSSVYLVPWYFYSFFFQCSPQIFVCTKI